jgi:hypothetical protein
LWALFFLMAILRPTDSRTSGAWSITGAASAHAALADPSDSVYVSIDDTDIVGGERIVIQLGTGGFPPEGDLAIRARAQHTGRPQDTVSVELNIWDGDPDIAGSIQAWNITSIAIPKSATTLPTTLNNPQQKHIRNVDDLWMELTILSQTGTAGLELVFLEIEVGDDPVGSWSSDLDASPDDTLIWVSMTDGRARQAKQVSGEWVDSNGDPVEKGFPYPDEASCYRTHRSVNGWGAI